MTAGGGEQADGGIVVFTPDDAGRLAAFEREFFPQPWNEEQLRACLGRKQFLGFGVEGRGRLAAYLTAALVAGELEIFNIAVRPEYRRQGLARRLLRRLLQLARETGMTDAYLEVRASNVAARALYAGFGFTCAGRRAAYYPDNREDALVMRLTCGDTDDGNDRKTGKEQP
jgi:ribosomal-protein-alanine N-acetyltransferase